MKLANRSLLYIPMVILLVFAQNTVFSQTNSFNPYWNLSVKVGPSVTLGDVKQNSYIPVMSNNNEWRLGGGVNIGYQISPAIGISGQGFYTKLAGTRRDADRFFEADMLEFAFNSNLNFLDIIKDYDPDRIFNPYILVGVGLLNYNSSLYELSSNDLVRKIGFGNGIGIGGRTLEGIFSGGIGFDIKINNKVKFNFESSNRFMNSDLMDLWDGGSKYDAYNITSVGLKVNLGANKYITRTKTAPLADPYKEPLIKTEIREITVYDTIYLTKNDTIYIDRVEVRKDDNALPVEVSTSPVMEAFNTAVVEGLEYRVQIRAKKQGPISRQYLAATHNLVEQDIKEDRFNGYYIYTLGSFFTYDNAIILRDQLRNNYGVQDAFIVAFKDGKRIAKLPQ